MTIKTVAAASLLSFGLLLSAAPSFAAASSDGSDAYQQGIAKLHQELADNYLLGSRRRERVDINLHTAEWLHQQGRDKQALSYLDFAIGQASLPY
ncbi:hypothetical protein [Azospirillum rugosum]|uniref:Tetratricopeptide repeat-containing protein n=1 Tax=Azospirillum rugosum TaxID=416170 RepID=A0ABS4SM37_9PROT|nr:hypothetical protein [Azospirillum rugosum]MBP2293627.1 hypothetical protein [Azospirillum rugosum]MDQ0527172.1 hypothetical protein [Azospirillum rugosum]